MLVLRSRLTAIVRAPYRIVLTVALAVGLILPVWQAPAAPTAQQALGLLAHPLTAADAERYRKIFALQESADWQGAERLVAELEDPLLLGHVLAQRYLHPTRYISRYPELAAWLKRYADHPDAARIHKLAQARRPAGSSSPHRPQTAKTSLAAEQPLDVVYLYRSEKRLSRSDWRKVQRLKRRIRRKLRRV